MEWLNFVVNNIHQNTKQHTHWCSYTNKNALEEIKARLNDTQLKMFRDSPFVLFLNLPKLKVQPQLLQSLMYAETDHDNMFIIKIAIGETSKKKKVEKAKRSKKKKKSNSTKKGSDSVKDNKEELKTSNKQDGLQHNLPFFFMNKWWILTKKWVILQLVDRMEVTEFSVSRLAPDYFTGIAQTSWR
ncbi:hypothetical protein RND71_021551 [Anisodus tanguticus]|uniref:Uncharacterized protein n=1 Tax=Anisodus tanguticus TaxID=243964 RepID=A0AAE1RXD6_9SOLA|nr:hypothetical protein RND71_021551 [Anisodus tanguticus]